MRIGFSNRNFDIVMVMDAILISLACVLVIMAYREISDAPVRNARAVGTALMLSATDFDSEEKPLLRGAEETEVQVLTSRLEKAGRRFRRAEIGGEISIYADNPRFKGISSHADAFRNHALTTFRSGGAEPVEEVETTDLGSFLRIAWPVRAQQDCRDCQVGNTDYFKNGDVIAIKEVRLPIGDVYARTIGKLLYAFGMLAAALMVYIGLIIPMFKRYRQERADISDRAQSFERQASTDPLTGLHNRRYFEQALDTYLREFNAVGSQLGLMILDLDHFKSVNDNYGHDAGDLLLKEIALRLKAVTREHDVVARIGGEEFAVITPYISTDQIFKVAERYRHAIQNLQVDIGKVRLRPTVSIGVATNERREHDIELLFRAADEKLYEAKRAGRNRVAA